MKWLTALLFLITLPSASATWKIIEEAGLGALRGGGAVRRVELMADGLSVRMTAIIFPSKAYTLRVVDSKSPGHTRLESSLQDAGCVAGVNGGYFHDDFRPVGLVIEDGVEVHPFEKARLLAGVLALRGRQWELVRSSSFKNSPDVRQAIQCGPMLVESGQPTVGLNATRHARRTVVATDGHGQWALIHLTSVTLADAAEILTLPGVLGSWKPSMALNLDGGSSTGLWADASPATISLPEFGQVRNYIGIVPR